MKRRILSEKNLVVLLFVVVLIVFSAAHEDSKKIAKMYEDTFQSISSDGPDHELEDFELPPIELR